MALKLPVNAKEGGVFGIKAEFSEISVEGEAGAPITPKEGLKWTLTDKDGNIINSEVLTPSSTVMIVLSGDDLALSVGYPSDRYLTLEGTYDSELGSNLEFTDEVTFQIQNLVGKS